MTGMFVYDSFLCLLVQYEVSIENSFKCHFKVIFLLKAYVGALLVI